MPPLAPFYECQCLRPYIPTAYISSNSLVVIFAFQINSTNLFFLVSQSRRSREAYVPSMYIMVKQLSKAKPTKNRHSANSQKLPARTVATPARKPVTLAPTSAGILPYLSAIHPKIRPPKIAPMKKTLWAVVGSALCSHTHPNCNGDL